MEKRMFQKAKLVAAMTLASTMMFGMTGCILGGDETLTTNAVGNNSEATTAPKGSIQGIVQDTNGNPIPGAKVFVGNRSAVTNQGGAYQLDNIAATGVTVIQGEDYDGGAIRVVIVPPAGYLGATVEVYSDAVIDHGRTSQGTIEEVGIASTNRFIDGFTAVAGDAVLPAIGEAGSNVTGVLRDKETGEPLANQTISLELVSVVGGDHTTSGDEISFSTISFPTTTAQDGSFEISGVANDSNLKFVVGGYVVESMDAYSVVEPIEMPTVVSTNDEVEKIHVGNLYASAISSDDLIAPFVIAIDEAVVNETRAKLHDDVTNVLTVRFSETLSTQAIDENSVKVRDITSNEYLNNITVTAGADLKSIVLTKNDGDFGAGHDIDIYLLRVDFQDASSNNLEFNNTDAGKDIVKFDENNVNGNADFIKLSVEVYQELNDEASIVTNESQMMVDDSSERELTLLDKASSVFADVDMQDGGFDVIDQLNSSEAQARIVNLIKASQKAAKLDDNGIIYDSATGKPKITDLVVGANTAAADDEIIRVDVARIKFTASNATQYKYVITDGADIKSITPVIDTISSPGAEINNGMIEVNEALTDVVFTLSNVEPGYVLTITSVDDFGNEGDVKEITLQDNVAVTTGLQSSYGEDDLESSSTSIGQVFGDGGELANPDAQSLIGAPLLNINSGMLADQFNGTHDAVLDSLYAANGVDENDDYKPYFTEATYDVIAYNEWIKTASRTIAISFTENLDWANSATAPATSVTGLTNWEILNDVILNSEAEAINSDIVAFNTNDIFELANVSGQNQSEINFTDVIQDGAGNVATAAANAKVVVFDALPPMVTKAEYLGGSIVIDFNEAIKLTDGGETAETALVVIASLGGIDLEMTKAAIDAFNVKDAADRKSLTLEFNEDADTEGGLPTVSRAALFPDASQYRTKDEVVAPGASGHAVLDFSLIQDNYRNTWQDDAAVIVAPTFAVVDVVGDMVNQSKVTTNFVGGEDSFTVVYKFSHPVTLEDVEGVDAANLFTLTSAASIEASNDTSIELTNNNKTVIVNVQLTGGTLSSDDEFEFASDVASLWDTSTSSANEATTITVQ